MTTYQPPLQDMKFLLEDVLDAYGLFSQYDDTRDVDSEFVTALLEQAGRFASEQIHPANYAGHEQGCRWEDGQVITPESYKAPLKKYFEAGWTSLSESPEYGGQGLPFVIHSAASEMNVAACAAMAFYTYRDGAISVLEDNASEKLKQRYLPNLVNGNWGGPMCLTESHCGSDLGLMRTRADVSSDGNYRITGTKIFITAGEDDFSENLIYLVLARLRGAPAGIKGVSLFLVPKWHVNDDGSLGERNTVVCGSIEHKMGLNGSSTCVMNFDGATGYLVGETNRGMKAMFKMVNRSRYSVGLQGTGISDVAYQNSVIYARERLQMRAPAGVQNPDGEADPIIVHPDVRRMLLTQRSFVEGSRALNMYVGLLFDQLKFSHDEETKTRCQSLLDLLTPICKGFGSELGNESVNLALQCYGGHGYIRENGMEQFVRDMRATSIYEGTTGIQGLDLLGRKVLAKGQLLLVFTREIQAFCESQPSQPGMAEFIEPLAKSCKQWLELSAAIGEAVAKDVNELGTASVDFLMYSGYVTLAYMWARMASAALEKNETNNPFYQSKLQTARFYFRRMLPRTETLSITMLSGADTLMETDEEAFLF